MNSKSYPAKHIYIYVFDGDHGMFILDIWARSFCIGGLADGKGPEQGV